VLVNDRPVACVVFVEGDALMGMTEKLRQDVLALLDWRAPEVLATSVAIGGIDGVIGRPACG
jgi:hypothetical protein